MNREPPNIRVVTEDGIPVEDQESVSTFRPLPAEAIAAIATGINPIRAIRVHRNMTMAQLAYMVGVDPSVISLLERGYRLPSREELIEIARALSVDIDDIRP